MPATIPNDTAFDAVVKALASGKYDDNPKLKYAMATTARQYKQERDFNRFAAQIDFSPKEPPKEQDPMRPGPDTMVQARRTSVRHGPTPEQQLAEQGIDVTTGADDQWLRTTAGLLGDGTSVVGFSGDKPQAMTALIDWRVRKQLKEQGYDVPEDMPVVYQVAGKPVYLRPNEQTKKLVPTLFDEAGLSLGDITELAGDVISVGMDVGGALGGAAIGTGTGGPGFGTVALGTVGAGLGAASARMVRKEIAKGLGVPADIADMIGSDEAFHDALWAAGGEGLVASGYYAFRTVRSWGKGGSLSMSVDELREMAARATEALKPVRRLEEKTGLNIPIGAGELTGEPGLLTAQKVLEQRGKGAISERIVTDRTTAQLNTAKIARIIENDTIPEANVLADIDGQAMMEMDGVTAPIREAGELTEQARRIANSNYTNVDGTGIRDRLDRLNQDLVKQSEYADSLIGKTDEMAATTSDLSAAKEAANQAQKAGWNNFRTLVGVKGKGQEGTVKLINTDARGGGNTEINRALNRLGKEGEAALSASYKARRNALGGDLERLREGTLDLNQLHVLQSHLKAQLRRMARGEPLGWDESAVRNLSHAIEKQIVNGKYVRMGKDSTGRVVASPVEKQEQQIIADAYQANNKATANYFKVHENDLARKLSDTNNPMPSDEVASIIFKPRNSSSLRTVLTALENNPARKANLMHHLENIYTKRVFGGSPTTSSIRINHQQFMDDYAEHIKLLTDGKSLPTASAIYEGNYMQRLGHQLEVGAEIEKNKVSALFGKTLEADDITGTNLIAKMFDGKLGMDKVRSISKYLGQADPRLWAEMKARGLEHIRHKVLKSSDLTGDYSGIEKLLRENKAALSHLYGQQYVKDLYDLQEVLRMLDRGKFGHAPKLESQAPWLQLSRSLLGPLSKKQRFITAVVRLDAKAKAGALRGIISNPEKLASYHQWSRLAPGDMARVQGLIQNGLLAYGDDKDKRTAEFIARRQGVSLQDLLDSQYANVE